MGCLQRYKHYLNPEGFLQIRKRGAVNTGYVTRDIVSIDPENPIPRTN